MDRISRVLPIGPEDPSHHRGARRRTTRYAVNAEVRVLAPGEPSGIVFNASAGGLRVALDKPVALGAVLDLELAFTDQKRSRERASVVWTRELPDGWLAGLVFQE